MVEQAVAKRTVEVREKMETLKGEMVDESKKICLDMAKDIQNIRMDMTIMKRDIIHGASVYADQVTRNLAASLADQLTNLKEMMEATAAMIESPATSAILALENKMDTSNWL